MRYYASTAQPTTLTSPLPAVTPGTTGHSISVASIDGMPTQYPFSLLVNWGDSSRQEVVRVTRAATGHGPFTFADCIRGDDGTNSPEQAAGCVVVHGVSARDFQPPRRRMASSEGGQSLPADTSFVPTSQTLNLSSGTYATIMQWLVTGQTDTDSPFGLVAGSLTYGATPVQGPAAWFGYNPSHLSAQAPSSPNGAVGTSMFGDAGDSDDGTGGHGLEMNPACFTTADGSNGTNAVEMVAMNDNTNTVNLVLRCGTGTVNGIASFITFCNADSSVTFAIFGQYIGCVFYHPVYATKGIATNNTYANLTPTASTPYVSIPMVNAVPTVAPSVPAGNAAMCYYNGHVYVWNGSTWETH